MNFKINRVVLQQTIDAYNKSIETLEVAMIDIEKVIALLTSDGWKGETKETFESVKYGDWKKGMEGHIDRVKFLKEILDEAKNKFDNISEQGDNLPKSL